MQLSPSPGAARAVPASAPGLAPRRPAPPAPRPARALPDVPSAAPYAGPPAPPLAALLEHAGVPPEHGAALFAAAADRVAEREWLAACGVPVAPWRAAATLDDARAAVAALARAPGGSGVACLLKPARRGAAGPGLRWVDGPDALEAAWADDGAPRLVERAVAVAAELHVLVARAADGAAAAYPAAESRRVECDGMPRLRWAAVPARRPGDDVRRAEQLAAWTAERLRVDGLAVVHLLLLADGRLVVNEVAWGRRPAPAAPDAGWHDRLTRAVREAASGARGPAAAVAVAPVYGDQWDPAAPWRAALALRVPGVVLRGGDGVVAAADDAQVAQVAASGGSPEDAVARAVRAQSLLGPRRVRAEAWHRALRARVVGGAPRPAPAAPVLAID